MFATYFFLLYMLVMYLVGGIVITGWYAITRGEWKTNPDGTLWWSGMIFSGWLRFWTEEKGKRDYVYIGDELTKLMMQVEPLIGFAGKYSVVYDLYILVSPENLTYYLDKRQYAEFSLGYKSDTRQANDIIEGSEKWCLRFYKEEPIYKFPSWVRKPLATCIYCFSSVYGSLVWWYAAAVFKSRFDFPFSWTTMFIFWVPYMIGLSFILPFLNKKI